MKELDLKKPLRTVEGHYPVEVLADDLSGDYSICGKVTSETGSWVTTLTRDGGRFLTVDPYIENYDPLEDVAVDTPGWVRNVGSNIWHRRHFAGVRDGVVMWWDDGRTSHTARGINAVWWNEYTFTKPEELK